MLLLVCRWRTLEVLRLHSVYRYSVYSVCILFSFEMENTGSAKTPCKIWAALLGVCCGFHTQKPRLIGLATNIQQRLNRPSRGSPCIFLCPLIN